jgi:beta-glucosidase
MVKRVSAIICVAIAATVIASPICSGQVPGAQARPKGPWMDKSLTPDQRAELVVKEMTLDEKIQLVHGTGVHFLPGRTAANLLTARANGGLGFVPGIDRLGLPDLNMNDGSMGPVLQGFKGRYATAMPSLLALAATWNAGLAKAYGTNVGRESADLGFNVQLGAGVNLAREARNGRNFEYLGEDPILAGTMVAQWIQGVQTQGVVADIKHYAVNSQETGRNIVNSVIEKRALRETDLLAFEIGVKQGKPGMVMCAYNKVNGEWACENDYLLNQVLKKEWGFQGWVISDWGATHSTVKAALAGLDMEQQDARYYGAELKKAVEGGQVPLSRLDDMVRRIVRTVFATGLIDTPQAAKSPDVVAGFAIAQRVAEEAMVLLKNDKAQLPLSAAGLKTVAVIGGHADVGVLSGAGSGQVSPAGGSAVGGPPGANPLMAIFQPSFHRSPPLKAIQEAAPGAKVTYDPGTDPNAAAAAAKGADVAIVFVLQHASEGSDLPGLALADGQDDLVAKVAAVNPRTIVVIESGGPVLMPWAKNVNAIVEAWFPGVRGGEALANLLFGKTNFSGKLPISYPASEADLPHAKVFAPVGGGPTGAPSLVASATNQTSFDAVYNEGLKVGYKWFDAEKKTPAYPFGFGLCYTSFAYSALKATGGASLQVTFVVKNTGTRAGRETAQVYLALPASAGEPPKRLVGWEKVDLKPGESKTVTLNIDPLYLSVFDAAGDRWRVVPGEYKVMAGTSSAALPLSATVSLQ